MKKIFKKVFPNAGLHNFETEEYKQSKKFGKIVLIYRLAGVVAGLIIIAIFF